MRLGLIAMSGVRACDPDLMRAGMRFPGVVERGRVIASLPSLSLLTLAALTPRDFHIEYHEIRELARHGPLPQRFDLVAISTFTAQAHDAYRVARAYRAAGVPVVMGGLHVTACPEEAALHCTSVVVGEGEPLWPRLLEDFRRGRLAPRYQAEPGEEFDLATAPVPRYDLLDPRRYNRLTLQTTRGCPHQCDFCASSILLTRRYKTKPVANVLREIDAIQRIWPRPFIELADDNSLIHPGHTRELLQALRRRRVPWFTETDISVARDEDLLAEIRRSGCRQLLVGLESPTGRGLDQVELRSNWKLRQVDRYEEAVRRIQSHGIAVNGCFILGLDGDTEEVFDAVRDFAERTALYDVQLSVLTAFPGTPLYQRLLRAGRILRPGAWDTCTLFDVNVAPLHMSPERLKRGLLELAGQMYHEDAVRRRRERFFAQIRRRRPAPRPAAAPPAPGRAARPAARARGGAAPRPGPA
jgi:radical SAM superfamily enzyme YgiQ (UPF0313 family)